VNVLKCILVQKLGFFFKYTGFLHGHKMENKNRSFPVKFINH